MSSIEVVKKELYPWTSSSGEIRYYVNDWFDLIGDVLESFVQNEWNAPPMDKMKRAKVWFDSSAHVHVDGLKDELTVEIIKSNIENRFFLRMRYHSFFTYILSTFSTFAMAMMIGSAVPLTMSDLRRG